MDAFNEGYIMSLIKEIEGIGCRCGTFSGCGIHSLCNNLRFSLFPKIQLPYVPKNHCNLHSDCKEADYKGIEKYGNLYNKYTGHCHDDCCEDCFGN